MYIEPLFDSIPSRAMIKGKIVFYDACSMKPYSLRKAKKLYRNFIYIGSGQIVDSPYLKWGATKEDPIVHFFKQKRKRKGIAVMHQRMRKELDKFEDLLNRSLKES